MYECSIQHLDVKESSIDDKHIGNIVIIFTQPLRSGRIWHKVNFFFSGV